MKSALLSVLVIFLLGSATLVHGQSDDDVPDKIPSSVRFSFKLPTTLANKSFKNLVSGIADFNFNGCTKATEFI